MLCLEEEEFLESYILDILDYKNLFRSMGNDHTIALSFAENLSLSLK